MILDKCKHSNACRIKASREFFGNSECPGTDDAEMTLWLVYSCNGASDKSSSHKPTCNTDTGTGTGTGSSSEIVDGACGGDDVEQGEMKQIDIPGCGGWITPTCNGGCINIVKVIKLHIISFCRLIIPKRCCTAAKRRKRRTKNSWHW